MASHTALARRLGATDTMLAAVRGVGPTDIAVFQPAWATALAYADAMTVSGHAVTDELYAALTRDWDGGQIVEITMVIGLFNYFNRFNDALRVAVTR
jgi:alkylhydroperoxidase family enzyme